MFKVTLAVILLVATVQADHCCPELKNSLTDVKSDVQELQDLVKDLRQKLGEQFHWPPSQNDTCPPGFSYLPSAKSCYKVVFESHNWTSAAQRCQELRPRSHLTAITRQAENNALKTFLELQLSKNPGNTACIPSNMPQMGNLFWTSGQRLIENDCKTPFVWKISSDEKLLVEYTNWKAGEPNCGSMESCLHLWAMKNFLWNDTPCNLKFCPVCEYKPCYFK